MIKFCLSSHCSEKFLAQADEIKTEHIKEVEPLLRKFTKAIVIYSGPTDNETCHLLSETAKKYDNRLVVCCRGLEETDRLSKQFSNLKIYNGLYTTTFLEVRTAISLGVEYLKLGAPLTHDLNRVSRFEIPMRLTPNIAYEDAIFKPYGIQGSWIRPEDFDIYNQFNVVYEFEDCDRKKEETLFDLYKNKKAWAGPMSYLFSNLDSSVLNRLIPPDLANEKINCRQKCMIDDRCHLCNNYFALADKELLGKIAKS